MTASPERALPVLRIGMFLFMLVWTLEKLIEPAAYQGIFLNFYGLDLGVTPVYALGILQLAVLMAFVSGAFKTASYGLVLAMNLISLLVSYRQILDPYDGANQLFVASIPVAAASLVLFLLRDRDTWLTVARQTNHGEALRSAD